jgi:EphA7
VTIDVAVKSLIDSSESMEAKNEFLREAAITWHFQHRNVVAMHGIVTSGAPYLLVLEFCSNGSLKDYLSKPANEPGIRTKYNMFLDVARGMEHLAVLGFVHRDLAARNVRLL